MTRSRKTKEKKEKKYPIFEKAVKLVELCADEGIFHTKTDCDDRDDCDLCPVGAECLVLWNNICSLPPVIGLKRFIECFEKLQKAKHLKKYYEH